MVVVKKTKKAGFTLVELLVTITIFVILTGVVLWNQNKFNSTILLTNLAYDTALTIRQAQTYGINIKEFNSEFLPYGVHFDTSSSKSFILFVDDTYQDKNNLGDGRYNDDTTKKALDTCLQDKYCVNKYSIKRGNYISNLYYVRPGEDWDDAEKADTLDIVFVRPNTTAYIRENNTPTEHSRAAIELQGADGEAESKRYVRVWKNGLIEITSTLTE